MCDGCEWGPEAFLALLLKSLLPTWSRSIWGWTLEEASRHHCQWPQCWTLVEAPRHHCQCPILWQPSREASRLSFGNGIPWKMEKSCAHRCRHCAVNAVNWSDAWSDSSQHLRPSLLTPHLLWIWTLIICYA